MKKFLIPLTLITLIFGSCKTSQLQSYQDDIYVSPSEEKKLARIAEVEKSKKEAEEKQKQEDAALAQKAKDDANPYYQDPQYNQDDYYDYKYASQMRRFENPVMGAGYYNNYYTNSYMYNQNPSMYGSSIYSSYNWWSPSNQFSNYSSGLSLCFSTGNYYNNYYGNGGYNPYGYNPYYSNSFYGCGNLYGGYNPYGYNSYGNGYNTGFINGYNWGYFNSYDVNSSYSKVEYGPRGSNGGGNSQRQTSAGMVVPDGEGSRMQFINAVNVQQENAPKFTDVPRRKVYNNSGTENVGNGQIIPSESNKTRGTSASENYQNNNQNNPQIKKDEGFWPRVFGGNQNTNSDPVKNTNTNSDNPVRDGNSNPQKIKSSSSENNNQNNPDNSNRTVNPGNSNSNSGGTSTPRGTGGESNRPR